jgi:hypothetical protein
MTLAELPDTVDLQLQWAYQLAVKDMKLIDFDHDGTDQILVAFNSDSGRAGLLDLVAQDMVWHSQGFKGTLAAVAAGDRNDDGHLDIICGGSRCDTPTGYIEIFNGPTYDFSDSCSGLDQTVLSLATSSCCFDSIPRIFVGTQYTTSHSSYWGYTNERTGSCFALEGSTLESQLITDGGAVRTIRMSDIDGDGNDDLTFGADLVWEYVSSFEPDWTSAGAWVDRVGLGELYLFGVSHQGVGGGLNHIWFGALEVASLGGMSNYVIASADIGQDLVYAGPKVRLACWNAVTSELQWSLKWDRIGLNYVSGLGVSDYDGEQTHAVCVAYGSGLIEFRRGSDGSLLAVSNQHHEIHRMMVGNIDQDNLTEICVCSGDSLYVYEIPSAVTGVEEIEELSRPPGFCLFRNYPNPFNAETAIRFNLPFSCDARLSVYDILGRKVRDFRTFYQAGTHIIIWDGRNSAGEEVASGIYLYRMLAGNYRDTKKMLLIR